MKLTAVRAVHSDLYSAVRAVANDARRRERRPTALPPVWREVLPDDSRGSVPLKSVAAVFVWTQPIAVFPFFVDVELNRMWRSDW